MTKPVIEAYFAAFNKGDVAAMLSLLDEDIEHHVNEGGIRRGKQAFAEFCAHMNRAYQENLTDIVVFSNEAGTRGAAEFTVNGSYLVTDPGLPEAKGQKYVLPAGSFFTLRNGKIARVTTYYNLQEWIRQVSA
ncbi:MAG: nuclear transport factor 2 family protein [Paracoccaceae bacterium]|nr:nuclear transport factor 2 family protein [Paracoccaceae bacterium]